MWGGGGSMDNQMAEWILTKLCRHDPWVPNVTPGGGKRNLNFPFKKWLSG